MSSCVSLCVFVVALHIVAKLYDCQTRTINAEGLSKGMPPVDTEVQLVSPPMNEKNKPSIVDTVQ